MVTKLYCAIGILVVMGHCACRNVDKPNERMDKVENNLSIRQFFLRADSFMDVGHYDSAQVWLNKIHLLESYQRPSLFSYFLTSRQAEVYYYNNLPELGMREAMRAQHLAASMKDSVLLLDAYNFIGLFHLISSRYDDAIASFKKSISYRQAVWDSLKYLNPSRPLHVFGNLSETYEKTGKSDSAVYYGLAALDEAKRAKDTRGIATAHLNIGFAYLGKKDAAAASHHFQGAIGQAVSTRYVDVELVGYSGLSAVAVLQNNKEEPLRLLNSGFSLLDGQPQLNDYYTILFLQQAEACYRSYAAQGSLIATLDKKANLLGDIQKRKGQQLQTVFLAGLENEKRIFDLELAEIETKQKLATSSMYIALLAVLLLIILFVMYRYFVRERLRVANLRNKISQDLHDEVGATLSGIAMYSHIIEEKMKTAQYQEANGLLHLIKESANAMTGTLHDIVWALSPVQDNLLALMQRLREYAQPLSDAKNITFAMQCDEGLETLKLPMNYRKNIYLIGKEAINNSMKHSRCKMLQVSIIQNGRKLKVRIKDDGIGFDSTKRTPGNGLLNMMERGVEIGGSISLDSVANTGTSILLTCNIPH